MAERACSDARCDELGEKVGTDSQRISRYESGRLTTRLAAAVRLAEALDVSVDYLVIEGASRRSLTDADSTLAARLAELGALDDTDRDAVLHIIYGLIAKKPRPPRPHRRLLNWRAQLRSCRPSRGTTRSRSWPSR